ncbi:hypothetical protein JXJ21_06845 [candidate division KSB1 bacterium]|nr:hypothetical protein [candidate division KSB1 bacterium]
MRAILRVSFVLLAVLLFSQCASFRQAISISYENIALASCGTTVETSDFVIKNEDDFITTWIDVDRLSEFDRHLDCRRYINDGDTTRYNVWSGYAGDASNVWSVSGSGAAIRSSQNAKRPSLGEPHYIILNFPEEAEIFSIIIYTTCENVAPEYEPSLRRYNLYLRHQPSSNWQFIANVHNDVATRIKNDFPIARARQVRVEIPIERYMTYRQRLRNYYDTKTGRFKGRTIDVAEIEVLGNFVRQDTVSN